MGKWITRPAGPVAAELAGWMLLVAAPALAVTPGQVSWTAEGVAALRAIAAPGSRPEDPLPRPPGRKVRHRGFLAVLALRTRLQHRDEGGPRLQGGDLLLPPYRLSDSPASIQTAQAPPFPTH